MSSILYEREVLQHEAELAAFVDLVRDMGASSYLEVGAKFGGSLWRVAQALRPQSTIVAIDLPKGTIAWDRSRPSLVSCIERLNGMGHEAMTIWGDSTDVKVVEQAARLGPFDVVFIDANHTLPYLEKDWANYGPMGKMVAFHDIGFFRDRPWTVPIDAPQFWDSIKGGYTNVEIRKDRQDNGIGVLWVR